MLTWILLVLALYIVQIYSVSILCFGESGLSDKEMMAVGWGSRDDTPELTNRGQRAQRALNNLKESLPIFLSLAVLAIVMEKETTLALSAAIAFFVARVIYVPLYIRAVPMLRSGVWLVAFCALFVMAYALI
ncbi:hypothetical protein A9Q99_17870 [Gammaproteobacteria bacterium 45_16_T64]|nr:hypothetical protein A9Q99_17870 [Gammaproteobacteria bacterium 45_16_T64]